MTIAVSTDYRKLELDEVDSVAARCDASWKDPAIPRRQWISVVRGEIERYRSGEYQKHFDVLLRTLKETNLNNPTLLDVGASSGFYSEILKVGGFVCRYVACDYSEEYQRLARELFPGIAFQLGDARNLPFEDQTFDIVLSGCVLLHVRDYEAVIRESRRVSRRFVVMNRTPVTVTTTFYEKLAYGCRTLEIHFGEEELLGLFNKHGMRVVRSEDVFTDPETLFGHRTYLLEIMNA